MRQPEMTIHCLAETRLRREAGGAPRQRDE